LKEAIAVREFGEDILEVEVNGIEGFAEGFDAAGW